MRIFLIVIIVWVNIGAIGWIIGSIADTFFYPTQKNNWRYIFLSMAVGPGTFVLVLRSIYEYWKDRRRQDAQR